MIVLHTSFSLSLPLPLSWHELCFALKSFLLSFCLSPFHVIPFILVFSPFQFFFIFCSCSAFHFLLCVLFLFRLSCIVALFLFSLPLLCYLGHIFVLIFLFLYIFSHTLLLFSLHHLVPFLLPSFLPFFPHHLLFWLIIFNFFCLACTLSLPSLYYTLPFSSFSSLTLLCELGSSWNLIIYHIIIVLLLPPSFPFISLRYPHKCILRISPDSLPFPTQLQTVLPQLSSSSPPLLMPRPIFSPVCPEWRARSFSSSIYISFTHSCTSSFLSGTGDVLLVPFCFLSSLTFPSLPLVVYVFLTFAFFPPWLHNIFVTSAPPSFRPRPHLTQAMFSSPYLLFSFSCASRFLYLAFFPLALCFNAFIYLALTDPFPSSFLSAAGDVLLVPAPFGLYLLTIFIVFCSFSFSQRCSSVAINSLSIKKGLQNTDPNWRYRIRWRGWLHAPLLNSCQI